MASLRAHASTSSHLESHSAARDQATPAHRQPPVRGVVGAPVVSTNHDQVIYSRPIVTRRTTMVGGHRCGADAGVAIARWARSKATRVRSRVRFDRVRTRSITDRLSLDRGHARHRDARPSIHPSIHPSSPSSPSSPPRRTRWGRRRDDRSDDRAAVAAMAVEVHARWRREGRW